MRLIATNQIVLDPSRAATQIVSGMGFIGGVSSVPAELKARVLTTNIDLDEGTCSVDLLESASESLASRCRRRARSSMRSQP